jgi:hypothetical protein
MAFNNMSRSYRIERQTDAIYGTKLCSLADGVELSGTPTGTNVDMRVTCIDGVESGHPCWVLFNIQAYDWHFAKSATVKLANGEVKALECEPPSHDVLPAVGTSGSPITSEYLSCYMDVETVSGLDKNGVLIRLNGTALDVTVRKDQRKWLTDFTKECAPEKDQDL